VDLEVIIINLISQIPMSIWLYNDGRTVVASTNICCCHGPLWLPSSDRNANIMRPRMISYLGVRCCFHATRYEMNEGLADIK